MYKILTIIFLVFTMNLSAADIKWAKDFKSGVEEAKKANKPIYFLSSNHSCRYCIKLKTTTLKDEKIIKELNDNFISIVTYSDDGDYMPESLWRPGTPASWFLLPSGEPMYQAVMGAVDAKEFAQMLKTVKEEFSKVKSK